MADRPRENRWGNGAAPPVGMTTTIPVEIVFAAGRRPVDLNNLFVADPDPAALVEQAEQNGFPQSACAWIKGIYGVIHKHGIRDVVGVVAGDCAETGALLDVLKSEGITVHPFAFPHGRRAEDLARECRRLAADLGTTLEAAEAVKRELDRVRALGREMDALAAAGQGGSGQELFESLLALTDFAGDPTDCSDRLSRTLAAWKSEHDSRRGAGIRLGALGVPPILSNLWTTLEALGADIVYHEVPRQFALLPSLGRGLIDAYRAYTYPYDLFARLEDIQEQIRARRLSGLIHYVQTFCHRQIHDRLLRARLPVPILTVEGDRPGPVDVRTHTRIEAFLERWSS